MYFYVVRVIPREEFELMISCCVNEKFFDDFFLVSCQNAGMYVLIGIVS